MQLTDSDLQYLGIMEFSKDEIDRLETLDKEALFKAISKQKKSLALKYHPDRTNDPLLHKKFLAIKEASDELLKSEAIKPAIFDGITLVDYKIPSYCFDDRMEEQIDNYFEKISADYLLLTSDEKKQFTKEHEFFLQFMQWFNTNRNKFHNKRQEEFGEAINKPALYSLLYKDWNKLVLQLFAEENLDDTTYREAIALGILWPHLAERKLLSPLKWISLLASGVYNPVTLILNHYFIQFFRKIIENIKLLPNNWSIIFPLAGEIGLLVALFTLPIMIFPTATMIMFTIPFVNRVLFYLANPVNQIIRPIAEYFDTSKLLIAGLVGGLGIALIAGGIVFASFNSLIATLLLCANVLSLLTIILSFVINFKLYKLLPPAGIGMGVIQLLSLLISFADTPPPPPTSIHEALFYVVVGLSLFVINCFGYKALANHEIISREFYTTLPLPKGETPEVVKRVMTEVAAKNNWSHTLFNTSLNAEVAPTKEKKPWHAMGLFGNKAEKNECVNQSSPSLSP